MAAVAPALLVSFGLLVFDSLAPKTIAPGSASFKALPFPRIATAEPDRQPFGAIPLAHNLQTYTRIYKAVSVGNEDAPCGRSNFGVLPDSTPAKSFPFGGLLTESEQTGFRHSIKATLHFQFPIHHF
jgi:hypothetical protein